MRSLPAILLLLLLTSDAQSQSRRRVIVRSTDKGDYFLIPATAFADSVEGILYPDKTLQIVRPERRPVVLYWNTACNDGSYNLTITPRQIFLSSGHNNPNRNYLFWALPISTEQFLVINVAVRRHTPPGFVHTTAPRKDGLFVDKSVYRYYDKGFKDCPLPADEDSTMKGFGSCCDSAMQRQVVRYINLLNGYIKTDSLKLKLPILDEGSSGPPKLFSHSLQELLDWMPIKRE